MSDEQQPAIVLDVGSGTCRVGINTDEKPHSVHPSIVGRIRSGLTKERLSIFKEIYCGSEAVRMKGVLSIKYPVEQGIVTDWETLEIFYRDTMALLHDAPPSKRPVLVTKILNTPKADAERITELMFEKFNTPAFFLALQPVLSMYASGRLTGVAVECGAGVCHSVPVQDGYAVQDAFQPVGVAGQDLTDYLMKIVIERDIKFSNYRRYIAKDLKEKLCYVAKDFDVEMVADEKSLEANYELPDGLVFTVGKERFRCPEALFQPSLLKSDSQGLHQAIHESIKHCDETVQSELYSNIVLCGGSTLFSGLKSRLKKELSALAAPSVSVKVLDPHYRHHSAWIGGALLSSMPDFQKMWITKAEYDENGAAIVNKKCP